MFRSFSQQQKWQIESLWEKYFSPSEKNTFDFSHFAQEFPHPLFPQFHFVKKFSPQHAKAPIFFDEGQEFFGMKEYQVLQQKNGVPVYLFDNHDLALFPFAHLKEFCGHTFDVVHIDAHRDDAIYPHEVTEKLLLQNIPEVLKKTRVSDYLDVATQGNVIGEIFSYTQSFEFESFHVPKNPYILNLDLDIFGPEGTAVSVEKKIEVIAHSWKNASAVVLATSPGYFSQDDAFYLAELFSQE